MLKAMIVDDEAPARSELRFLLDETGQTEVVAEAGSVREAIEKLKEFPCDVIFLDINMPEATGLQLADALRHLKFPPAVVFVTAYSEHALDAFKVEPFDPDSELKTLPNVVLTPHSAAVSTQAVRMVFNHCAGVIASYMRGDQPRSLLNPEYVKHR